MVGDHLVEEKIDVLGIKGKLFPEIDQSFLLDVEVVDPLVHHIDELFHTDRLQVVDLGHLFILNRKNITFTVNLR